MIFRAIEIALLFLLAGTSTAVVRTRDPAAQAIALGFFGLLLAGTFVVFQAPDVALSQIVVGAVAQPLMILLALARIRRDRARRARADDEGRS